MAAFHARPAMSPRLSAWLDRSRRWDIEYRGYLSNHITHYWVVLGALDAPEQRYADWEDLYTSERAARLQGDLEPPRKPDPASAVTEADWADRLESSRAHYPEYLEFFEGRVRELGIGGAVAKYVPVMLPGLAGAAFHALIQAGWGVEAGHEGMVAEGLAYLATAQQPIASNPDAVLWDQSGPGPVDLALKYLSLAAEADLPGASRAAAKTPKYKAMKKGEFQHRMIAFDDSELPLGRVLNGCGTLGLPDGPLLPSVNQAVALIAAAVAGSRGEFFAIHGATSLLGLLALSEHLTPGQQRDGIAHWWRGAMAALTVQGLPGLEETGRLLREWKEAEGKGAVPEGALRDETWWREALERCLDSYDEHVPKLVYVVWRWWRLEGLSQATRWLCVLAAEVLAKPNELMHENLWYGK